MNAIAAACVAAGCVLSVLAFDPTEQPSRSGTSETDGGFAGRDAPDGADDARAGGVLRTLLDRSSAVPLLDGMGALSTLRQGSTHGVGEPGEAGPSLPSLGVAFGNARGQWGAADEGAS